MGFQFWNEEDELWARAPSGHTSNFSLMFSNIDLISEPDKISRDDSEDKNRNRISQGLKLFDMNLRDQVC